MDWHPDGTKLTFDTESNLQGDIHVVNADGSGLQLPIEGGFGADWSPDGRRIAFARLEQKQVFVMNADESNEQQLTCRGNAENPTWSPDGDPIAFADLDEDGDLDAMFANPQKNSAQVWLNDGKEMFVDTGRH